ncbi:MAG: Rrf2 family transcriptional regulator, partial [Solirubrobacterales bacterium]|nr:Rrf2 family transcriptional regulator [Solirubrobacterales bacterium]
TRATQTLDLVRAKPGITIPELAEAMKIQPNYLYRVLPGLEKDGQIKREGRGWHPA